MADDKKYPRVGVGAFIENSEGQFFLAKRGAAARMEQGLWEFPGGAVEFGESPEEALIREIKEEHDVQVQIRELVYVCTYFVEEKETHWISLMFLCEITEGKPKILELDACTDIGWFSLPEIKTMELASYSKIDLAALERWLLER